MNSTSRDMARDMLIIGGGAAGLTAALVLARARHRVTVIDDQTHRNATVDEFHGFPTRDATAPNRFRTDALAELHSYGVGIVRAAVTSATSTDGSVSMKLADGTTVHGDAVVLATGVHDELPSIDGLAERWGKSVFNCPFCDGWEQRDQPVVVIDAAPGTDHLVTMIRSWTPHVTVVNAAAVSSLVGRRHHPQPRHAPQRPHDRGGSRVREGARRATQLNRASPRLRGRRRRLHPHERRRRHQSPTRMGRRRRTAPAAHAASGSARRSRRLHRRHRHPQDHRHAQHRGHPAGGPMRP